jgi:hemoglobin-like flavoprotein
MIIPLTHISSCCSLFTRLPETKVLFGFAEDVDPHSPELFESKSFVRHSAYLVQMIDTAVNLLGPDIETLTEIMYDLGIKHIRFGVEPYMFPIMGQCLIDAMEESLDEKFKPDVKEAWQSTFDALSGDMIASQKQYKKNKK